MKIPFHVKRVIASVSLTNSDQTEPSSFEVRLMLNDLTPKGMGVFSAHKFSTGEEITITLESPRKIQMKGRVAWIQEYDAQGKVITAHAFSHRVGLTFAFASTEEEQAVKAYCDEVLKEHHCLTAAA